MWVIGGRYRASREDVGRAGADKKTQKAKGVEYSSTEVLGHELKHGYNTEHRIDNSALTVDYGIRAPGFNSNVGAPGEEVDAVNFQNVVRKSESPWLLPRSEYGVDVSSRLATPTIVVPFVDKVGYTQN